MSKFELKLFNSWAGLDTGSEELILIEDKNEGKLTKTVYSRKRETISQDSWEILPKEIEELKKYILKEKLLKKKYPKRRIYDASFGVSIILDDNQIYIENYVDVYNELRDLLAKYVGRRLL